MLTDVKKFLELTKLKVAETCFAKPPALPYIVFLDNTKISGADYVNCIASRDISVELYSQKIDRNSESLIEELLNEKSIEYEKNRTWIDSERMFQTVYDFLFVEKL